MKFTFYLSLCAESFFTCSQGASCRSLALGPSDETPWCEMTVPTPQLCGVSAPGTVIQDGSQGAMWRDAEPSTVIQDGGQEAVGRDAEPSTVIQDGGQGAVCRDADPEL